MNRLSTVVVVLLAAILTGSVGCARKPDDAKISSDIKGKFSQDSGLSTKQLSVQASNGVVTLAGFVDNDAQRTAAALQAASVAGVKEVVNNLQVGSADIAAPKPGAKAAAPTRPQQRSKPIRSKQHPANASDGSPWYDSAPGSTGDGAKTENSKPPALPPDTAPAEAKPSTPPPSPPPTSQKVTIEQGTSISIRLVDSIDTEKNQTGDTFHANLNAPLSAEGIQAIPAGTDVTGHIVDLKSAGKFKGQSLLVLQLDSIIANGKSYNLQTDQYRKEGASRGKNTAEKVGGGAIVGGIIGAIAGGGKGAAIGSAAGAGVGGGAQAASKSKPLKLPSETVLNFTLQAPVTVSRPPDPNAGRQKLGDSQ
jgi:BON domain